MLSNRGQYQGGFCNSLHLHLPVCDISISHHFFKSVVVRDQEAQIHSQNEHPVLNNVQLKCHAEF